jgi:predicted MFS family arabinose efflux permease
MIVSIFIFGAGYSSSRLSRYAAADLYPADRRSSAIGWNVWAATIGSVVGPLLLETTRRAGEAAGFSGIVGPFVLAAVTFGVAGLAVWLLYSPVDHAELQAAPGQEARTSPAMARLAVVSLVIGQVVMVLVMTMTPIHIRHGGGTLDWVGVVFASHTFGMFAFSPIAGILSDRMGRVPMIVAASGLLAAAGLLSATSAVGSWYLALALFLLGLGWCFSFVAASALLTESVPASRRLRVQGVADSLIWGSAAVAGLSSGVLLAAVGYPTLGYSGAVLALTPLLFLRRARLAPVNAGVLLLVV